MDLTYRDIMGKVVAVVYEGASDDILIHTIIIEDGSKLQIYDIKLQLIDQPDLSNFPKTPLGYRNDVGICIKLEKYQALERPCTLHLLHQEPMSCNHRIYHLPFRILFCLASMGFVPKRLLELRNKPPLCVACKFGAAHRFPWRIKGKKSGSIRRPEKINPGDGVLVDHIVSAQTCLIPQMIGFLTIQSLWGCTTFLYHVSDYVYFHIMIYLSLPEMLLAKETLKN